MRLNVLVPAVITAVLLIGTLAAMSQTLLGGRVADAHEFTVDNGIPYTAGYLAEDVVDADVQTASGIFAVAPEFTSAQYTSGDLAEVWAGDDVRITKADSGAIALAGEPHGTRVLPEGRIGPRADVGIAMAGQPPMANTVRDMVDWNLGLYPSDLPLFAGELSKVDAIAQLTASTVRDTVDWNLGVYPSDLPLALLTCPEHPARCDGEFRTIAA